MIPSLQKEFSKINVQLDALFKLTSTVTETQFNYKPDPDQWSIGQIFQHLVNAETNTNIYLRKKILAGPNLKDSGMGTSFNFFLMKYIMIMGIKFKAPPIVTKNMEGPFSLEVQTDEWKRQREDIRQFVAGLDKTTANKLLFKHGIGVYLNIHQMLKWMHIHVARHQTQIKGLMKSPRFPEIVA